MRCLNCCLDGLALQVQMCPRCGAYLPSLMRDVLPPGTLLQGGNYRIEYALGQGGFGITYRAVDLNLERVVAVKEFYPQSYVHREGVTGRVTVPTADGEAYQRWLQRFEREGRILAKLTHPGIVKVHSLFRERDTAYLVMELLQGGTLSDELKAFNQLSPSRVSEIVTALVSSLDAAHRQGVYHLDLKPDNVMLTNDGRIVLVDFGAARQEMSSVVTTRHKKSTTAYTPEYAPLELVSGDPVGPESDLFELGMLIHEMLTGQRPPSVLQRLTTEVWEPPSLQEPWRELLTQALQLHRHNRPRFILRWWQARTQTASELIWAERMTQKIAQKITSKMAARPPEPQAEVERWQYDREATLVTVASRGLTQVEAPVLLESPKPQLVLALPKNIPLPKPHVCAIEVVTVDNQGEVILKESQKIRYFTEDLGLGVRLEMAEIPAGRFIMGSSTSPTDKTEAEFPQHMVIISRFFLGRLLITQAQWQAVMGKGNNPSRFKVENHPVEQVSWHEAQEFCQKLAAKTGRPYRLPSEAEWEYACRAGTKTPFHFGPTITSDLANYDGNYTYELGCKGQYRQKTTPVGSFPANAFGLHDMHGNVWEWCEDIWHENYLNAPRDGSAWLKGGDSDLRLLRGGSWGFGARNCRSSHRGGFHPEAKDDGFGFRVALSP
jgi:eukaryotic-like serine/threonine-protein kinase